MTLAMLRREDPSFLPSSWTLAERRAAGRDEIEIVGYSQIVKEVAGRVTRGDAGERKLWDSFNAGGREVESGRMDEICWAERSSEPLPSAHGNCCWEKEWSAAP